jgi:hypothetical protein
MEIINLHPFFLDYFMTYNIFDVVKDEIRGTTDKLEKDEVKQRIAVCNTCTSFVKLTRQCGLCGCFVDQKAKYRQSQCDANKWPF